MMALEKTSTRHANCQNVFAALLKNEPKVSHYWYVRVECSYDICHAFNTTNFTSQRAFNAAILSLSPTTRLFRVVKGQVVEVYRMWWVPHPDQ